MSVVHACPPGHTGVTPCCGRTPFELPRTSRMTVDPALVTCVYVAGSRHPRSPVRQAADVLSDEELSDALNLWYQARVFDASNPVVHLLTISSPLADLTTTCCHEYIRDLPGTDHGTSNPIHVTCDGTRSS